MTKKLKAVLSIAGSDPSGGAGIQADLKTMTALGVYGMSAITALTAQNTQGVFDILPVPVEFFKKQLDLVLKDIRPDAIKIGMVGRADLILAIKEILETYKIKNIVLDPVMVSSSGKKLLDPEALKALDELFKISKLITPNLLEAQVLLNRQINTIEELKIAAHAADIAKGIKGARDIDDQMAEARANLDWERQFELAIDPERARQIREDREPEDDDTCSMCGKFCAIRSMNKALAGEEIDIL